MNIHVKVSTEKQIQALQKRELLDGYMKGFSNLEKRIIKRFNFLVNNENLIPNQAVIILVEDYAYPKQFITKLLSDNSKSLA